MDEPLKILFVEDLPTDVEIAKRTLTKGGIKFQSLVVDNEIDFISHLKEFQPSLIISDYSMPKFDGMEALKLSLVNNPNTPFILLTGSMNEETAVECMKAGASDYVIKEHITRLPFAVKEVLEKNKLTLEKNKVRKALIESEERFRSLYENSTIGLYRTTPQGEIILANSTLVKMLGYQSFEELAQRNLEQDGFEPNYERKQFLEQIEKNGEVKGFEAAWTNKDGKVVYMSESARALRNANGKTLYYDGTVEDITERRLAQDGLNESELRFKQISDFAEEWIWEADKNGLYTYTSPIVKNILGYESEELIGKKYFYDFFDPEIKEDLMQAVLEAFANKASFKDFVNCNIHKDGRKIILSTSGIPIVDKEGNLIGYRGVDVDITERKRVEDELLASKLFIEEIINSIPVRVFWKDKNLVYLGCNTIFAADAGFSNPREIIGKDDFQMVWRDQAELYRADDRSVIESGISKLLIEEPQTTPEGKSITVLTSKIPLCNSKGVIIGMLGTYIDITDRKQAEDKIRKLYTGIEHSPTSVVITDIKGNIEYVNTKFSDVTGYDYNEIIGRNPKFLQSGEMLKSEYKEMWNTILSGNDWQGEFHNKKKNGELYWESASISPIKNDNGEVTHFIGIKEDITEKKIMIEELIQAKEKAEEMSRLKSNFLANMSHELRTPLVGILGYAEIICQEKVSSEIKAMAETIYKSGNRLSETLNLILDLSRLESEKMEIKYQRVELVEKTKEVISLFKEAANKKGLLLISSFSAESILINFDERAYYSILNNLINNAIKFTSEGSITTSVSLGDRSVEISVTDTGIGIDKNDYQSIFDEFRQASEGYTRNFEGSGLGLSITKKIVEKFGGTITLESEIGKGTTFKVILPVTNALENLKEPTASEIHSSTKSPVTKLEKPLGLLVDDDPHVFQVMKRYLIDYVELETIVDAEFAAKMLKKKKYDIIFMDINLRRGMDGKKAASMIRTMDGYEFTPIIATTSYALAGDKEEFILAGCSHYLSKPFNKTEIIDVVTEALKQ